MRHIVDLTLPLYDGMRGVAMEPHTHIADAGYNTTNLHIYSHAGTHMDAPRHFVEGGGSIDQIALETCIGPARVIDLSYKEPNSLIMVEDVTPFAHIIGVGTRLLIRTDWDLHADQQDYRTHMPRISPELADWLVDREIALLGLETPSVASLRPENRDELIEVHQILLEAQVVIVESLTNLRLLSQDLVEFIALPLKIRGCDGTPVRAIAIQE